MSRIVKSMLPFVTALLIYPMAWLHAASPQVENADADTNTVRVFIFAGQSNMVGSDSKVEDIKRFRRSPVWTSRRTRSCSLTTSDVRTS